MINAALLFYRIHLRRYLRILNQLGLFRVLILGTIIVLTFKAFLTKNIIFWQAIALLSVLAGSHFRRKDFVLLNNLGLNHRAFFMILYLIFLLPFIIFYFLWPDYTAALVLIGGTMLVSMFTTVIRFRRKLFIPSFKFIKADAWEWRAGLKRSYPMIIIAYLIPAFFHRHDFLFGASVLLIAITTNSFQLNHESINMLEALNRKPVNYLVRKISLQLLYFSLISLPLCLIFFILYPEGFRPVLLIFLNCVVVQVFAVSLKYAGYIPGHVSKYNFAISAMLNFAFVIPAFLPLPLIMTYIFTRKAIIQLKQIMA